MKKKLFALALACLGATGIHADEGMWMLSNLSPKTQKAMKDLGLTLTAEELYSPDETSLKDAVVNFGGFCSGVVVSPEGLVFNNHHCGFGHIQALATPENDILKNGFVAHNREEERPAPGLFVAFLDRTEDVTAEALAVFDSIYAATPDGKKRYGKDWKNILFQQNIRFVCSKLEEKYERPDKHLIAEVLPFYGGNAFFLSLYKEYTDIRLVFTPTKTLGKFGGETDNWMWPRHTADFSVWRIYAGPDNEPATYSPNNKPYQAKRHAVVSLKGYSKGDYCMTVGYPGSTDRYLSSFGIAERVETENKPCVDVRGAKQDVWKKWMEADPVIGLKYASKYAKSSNYWKNSIGMNEAIKNLQVIESKQGLEQQVQEWIKADKGRKDRFGNVLGDLKRAYEKREANHRTLKYLDEVFFRGMELPAMALTSRSAAKNERAMKSLPGYYKDYDARVDQETAATLLKVYKEAVAKEYLPAFYATIDERFGGNFQAFVEDLFNRSMLDDANPFEGLAPDAARLKADAAVQFGLEVLRLENEIRRETRAYDLAIAANEKLLCQAILEMEMDSPHYSDANFTMRMSYGFVNDYTNGPTHYNHFTTAPTLLDKIARQDEIADYRMEAPITSLLKKGDWGPYADKQTGELQLCFLTNNDITGGNSGSPMFNGKGELVGLAFDGNWDALSSDISFTQSLTRCIGVDIRFVLYLMDKWGGADHLIREIGAK